MRTQKSYTMPIILALAFLAATNALADKYKAGNTNWLNQAASWTNNAVPTSTEFGVWSSIVAAPNTTNTLGADMTWGGIKIINPGGPVTLVSGNTLTLAGVSGIGIDMSAATVDLTVNCGLTLAASQSFIDPTNRMLTVGGVVSGSGSLTKSGFGALTLSGNNTFAGGVTISQGSLWIKNSNALGAGSKTVDCSYGTLGHSQLHLDGTGGNLTLPSTINYLVSNWADPGTIYNEGGNNVINGNFTVTSGGGGLVFLINAGSLTLNGTITPDSAGRGVVFNGAGNAVANGVIADGANYNFLFIQQGVGTTTLAAANTYKGTTDIRAGALLVNGSLASASVVTVKTNATLGGNGTIGGPVTVQTGAALSPGVGGIGTLTVNNTLTLAGTTLMEINRTGTPNCDRITGITTLTNGGILTVNNLGPALQAGDTFILFTAANYRGTFASLNLPLLNPGLAWDTTQLSVNGRISVFALPVQNYSINIHTGFNLIANQLDWGSNTLNQIMPVVPDGSIVYKYNNTASNWTASAYNAARGLWVPGYLTLNPGEGAFLQSPSNFTLTFTGTPHVPVLPVTIPNGSCYLVSRQTNDIGLWTNIIGTAPANGAHLYKWTGVGYSSYNYTSDAWNPSEPSAAVGESVWISPSGGIPPPTVAAAPLILSWPATQLVPVGSNVTFSVSVAGLQPISLQWFKNVTPVASATGSVFTISSVTLTNTAYYYLIASNAFGVSASPATLLRAYYLPPNNPVKRDVDFGDLPSTNWTCWQSFSVNENCDVQPFQYTTKSIPPIIYPTTLAQNGARHSWLSGNADYTWLGESVSPTPDGIPNAGAKGDPGLFEYSDNGTDFSAVGILQEENGIRMIPSPFHNDIPQAFYRVDQEYIVDPRSTSQGTKGNNLFGSAANYFVPASEGNGNVQIRQCYAPGQTVWFTVEAYNLDYYENGVSYLNVWIDYGKDNNSDGDITGNPDGKFQPSEYVIVDQPLWGWDLLETLSREANYPYDTSDAQVLAQMRGLGANGVWLYTHLPSIGVQPFASNGLQVVWFKIPSNLGDLSCGKSTFARFRISKEPLNLFRIYNYTDGSDQVHFDCHWPAPIGTGYDPYSLTNAAGQPDPSLGEVNDGGEVEDYPIYFAANCNPSGTLGSSTLCLSSVNTLATFSGGASALAGWPIWNQPTTLQSPVSSAQQTQITVANSSFWPAVPFYVEVSDVNTGNHEIMRVTAINIINNVWTVVRGASPCTPSPLQTIGANSPVALADRCQCALDSLGWKFPYLRLGLLNVSGSDPTLPCALDNRWRSYDPIPSVSQPSVVEVANSGSFDVSGVTVNWSVPTNAVFFNASVSQGTWTNQGGTISFNLGLIQVGATAQIGISLQPKSSGTINYQFNLSADQPLLGATNFQVVSVVNINPFLSIVNSSNKTVTVTWPTNDVWNLQQNSSLVGGWTNAPFQTSPYTLPANQAKQFYRLSH